LSVSKIGPRFVGNKKKVMGNEINRTSVQVIDSRLLDSVVIKRKWLNMGFGLCHYIKDDSMLAS
jgi:hypothetical protein